MTTAAYLSPALTQLTGNLGGSLEALPNVSINGGRERVAIAVIALAVQTSGSQIGLVRLPIGAIITGITLITSVSLGTSTLSLGDVNNSTLYTAASTYTTTDTPQRLGKASSHGTPITVGYDCFTGLASVSYEDITATIAVANLPGSGTLTFIIEYALD